MLFPWLRVRSGLENEGIDRDHSFKDRCSVLQNHRMLHTSKFPGIVDTLVLCLLVVL